MAADQAPIIEVNHVSYRYQDDDAANALSDLSFAVNAGEWLAVVGHNGSGKSTMANLLNGLLTPREGTITVAGIEVNEDTVWDVRHHIGMVFQNPDNQFVGATVEDDIAFGLENRNMPRDEMLERVHDAMVQVGMNDFAKREPASLSGGQKQRVALAGVIAMRPEIVILDESTSMLDPEGRAQILAIIHELRDAYDLTILSITHDLNEAASADRILVLDDGHFIEEDVPAAIFADVDKLVGIGLDVPFSQQLKQALSARKIMLDPGFQTTSELEATLWTSLSKM